MLSNAASISHQTIVTTRVSANVHKMSLQCNFAPAQSSPTRIVCVQWRDNILSTTKFFEPLDALVASLQPRETLHQSSDLAALFQQFAFHSLMIFHVFSFLQF